jgi:hypothetical protein
MEERFGRAYQYQAFQETQQEYGKYFEALSKHPRLLVGTVVPSLNGEGDETLRDANDAKEWQDAVRSILQEEVLSRANTKFHGARDFMETIHSSVDLFKNNPDLIPGTKKFNRRLADRFAQMAQPYEIRFDGKLHGYSIPVQPIIDNLRREVGTTPTRRAAPKATEPPQAGLQSKAPSTSEKEDFSTLFGTIGLPNLRI